MGTKTCVVYHPERAEQPYSVWYKGQIIWFDKDPIAAQNHLSEHIKRETAKGGK